MNNLLKGVFVNNVKIYPNFRQEQTISMWKRTLNFLAIQIIKYEQSIAIIK